MEERGGNRSARNKNGSWAARPEAPLRKAGATKKEPGWNAALRAQKARKSYEKPGIGL
jgi:hypothetical protein